MIRPTIETLLERVPGKYQLVMLAARRARELHSGQLPLIDVDSKNPVTIALEEVAAARVNPEPLSLTDE
ncbi:MAG: DNA-directed RNA polymerase subunit omega [Armatimonadetes bacterium]|nr:DNA-directed RNA polymerase subunit omega [Armatimonadota bacterium]